MKSDGRGCRRKIYRMSVGAPGMRACTYESVMRMRLLLVSLQVVRTEITLPTTLNVAAELLPGFPWQM